MSNNKDPAFLFYSSDFLVGVSDLTMEERGQYITLICIQHAKGHLSEKNIKIAVGDVSKDVLAKFEIDENGLYYNSRLEKEMLKRENYAKSRYENGCKGGRPKKTIEKPYGFENETICQTIAKPTQNHSENENININEIINNTIIDSNNIKHKYGEFNNVLLTDIEYEKLKEKYPSNYQKRIDDLSLYISSKGNKYKSHYHTIISWDRRSKGEGNENSTFDADEFFEMALKRTYGDDWKGIK